MPPAPRRVVSLFVVFILLINVFVLVKYRVEEQRLTELELRQTQAINPHNFKYLMNPGVSICQEDGENVLLLALVPVAAQNMERRLAVRTSWANKSLFPRLRYAFIIGESKNKTINEQLLAENAIFGDMVQESFMDTYRNLTLKSIMGVKWAATYCSKAKFILKVDDDVIVNVHYLTKYLDQLVEKETHVTNTFLCHAHHDAPVNRSMESKWYVSPEEYADEKYQTYCDGPAYMFTGDLALPLYQASLSVKLIFLEDVYMGMLGNRLNATFVDLEARYMWWKKRSFYSFLRKNVETTFFIYMNKVDDFLPVWRLYLQKLYKKLFNVYFI